MKMRFRVSSKDLMMFIIFAVVLLYLCALATGNLNALSGSGNFPGLNPIPGLTKFLGATLFLFFVLLVFIITSVSSVIFDREKGIGLKIGEKESKGYSRWAKDKEIKTDKDVEEVDPLSTTSPYAGIPLVNDGSKLWVDNGEYHNLVIGATGSGKSQTIVEPMVELLVKKGESMIITDPKGELYKAASDYMKERGYNVIVLNFRDPQNGNAWNPLTLPYQYMKDNNSDKATEILDDVALNILYDPNNKGEPFWEKSAADYFSGLALGLFEDAKPDEINLNSINFMSTVGEEKFAGASTYIKEYFTMKGEASNAYVFASNTINSPADTKGGILSVFRQKIRLFASRDNLSEMLSHSDFDIRDIGKQKTAVFVVIQDEKTTYHALATIFIKQCYETLIDVAQANGGKLPFRTNFILDEFANMPPLKDVTTMVTAARSRDIRFTFIIQNFAQLKAVYGNENAETIKGNCGNLVYLISTELAALEEISKMCGEVKSKEKDKTASTPLVTVTDLQKLKLFEAIILRWRKSPFKTKYTPNFKMDWGHPHKEAKFPEREKGEVALFDVKSFVKEKKRQNMLNSLDGKDGNANMNPFGGANPFGGSSPFGGGASPFGGGANPFGGSSPFGSGGVNPFAPSSNQSPNPGMFGGLGGGLDLDAMMKDIDRKIAELDAEEARQKEELAKKQAKADAKGNIETKPQSLEEKLNNIDKEFKLDDTLNGLNKNNETSVKDATIIEQPKEQEQPQINLFDQVLNENNTKAQPKEESKFNLFDQFNLKEEPKIQNIANNEQNVENRKPNIAIATSSPVEEIDTLYDELPPIKETSIIQPEFNNRTVIKPTDNNQYNIYNTIPNVMEDIRKEEPKVEEVKETKEPHINIDPDSIVIDNSIISDDEFFDDFFSDD